MEPGRYTVEMALYDDGEMKTLVNPVSFDVMALENTVMPAENRAAKVAFQKQVAQLDADLKACKAIMNETATKLKYIKSALKRSELPYGALSKTVLDIENKLKDVSLALYGDPVKTKLDISQPKSPASRIGTISHEQKYSTSAPTQTHKDSYNIAKTKITALKQKVEVIFNNDIKQLEDQLIKYAVPYTPGRGYENDH